MSLRLTKRERAEVFRARGGSCHVCGSACDPLEPFHVAELDGDDPLRMEPARPAPAHLVILGGCCVELKRGRSWGELRLELDRRLREANAVIERYGLLWGDQGLVFDGECPPLPADGSLVEGAAVVVNGAELAAPPALEGDRR